MSLTRDLRGLKANNSFVGRSFREDPAKCFNCRKLGQFGWSSMKISILLFSLLASFAFAAGTYDHWALHLFRAYEYKTPITEIGEPYIAIHEAAKGQSNDMHLIHSGVAALYKRLEMIERAQKNIELEYFIFSLKKKNPKPTENGEERSVKFILNKLIDKAVAGVQVRILVDKSFAVHQFDDEAVTAVKRIIVERQGDPNKFQVHYYNSMFYFVNDFISISNFRNHRKLLSIDDQEAITGGRNIEDKYFDLDHSYNFLDRDIWVKGSVVPVMRTSFDKFWRAGVVDKANVDLQLLREPSEKELSVKKLLQMSAADQALLGRVMSIGKASYETSQTHSCPKTIFASDKPLPHVMARWCLENFDKNSICEKNYKEEYRITERVIGQFVRSLNHGDELYVESPYVMLNTRSGNLLKYLTEKGIKLHVSTNSLASTDATYAAAAFYREVNKFASSGIKMTIHGTDWRPTEFLAEPEVRNARWGHHVKSHLYGNKGMFVGTYNVDNRSSFYNSEMGLFCSGSPGLNADLKHEMLGIMNDVGYRLHNRNHAVDSRNQKQNPLGKDGDEKKLSMYLQMIPVYLLQFLF